MLHLEAEHDLVMWTESFMSEWNVRLVINGQGEEDHEANTGIPQGSPVSPILFTIYLSGLFGYMEDKVPDIKPLSFVDDVAWLAEGKSEDVLSTRLEEAAKAAGMGRRKCGNLRHGQDQGDCPEQEKKNHPGRRPRHYGWGKHSLLQ